MIIINFLINGKNLGWIIPPVKDTCLPILRKNFARRQTCGVGLR